MAELAPARTVSFDDYLEHYAHDFYEWVDGELIKLTGATWEHNDGIRFCANFLEAYLALTNTPGKVLTSPFVQAMPEIGSGREPDVMLILEDKLAQLDRAKLRGPADICIEIVSDESIERDRGAKLREYEMGGVREYWLFDPARRDTTFYRLNADGVFIAQPLNARGEYETPLLPRLRFPVALLWQVPLPTSHATGRMVEAMLPAPAE